MDRVETRYFGSWPREAFRRLQEPPDLLSTLPVEEKTITGLPVTACDGLFPLPVDEKAVMGAPAALRAADGQKHPPRIATQSQS